MDMDLVALLAWIVTALGGFFLLGVWLAHGGLRQPESGPSPLPAALTFGHMAVAAIGLLVWIAFVLTDKATLAWSAIGLLAPVVLMGFGMLMSWIPVRRGRAAAPVAAHAGRGADAPAAGGADTSATGGAD